MWIGSDVKKILDSIGQRDLKYERSNTEFVFELCLNSNRAKSPFHPIKYDPIQWNQRMKWAKIVFFENTKPIIMHSILFCCRLQEWHAITNIKWYQIICLNSISFNNLRVDDYDVNIISYCIRILETFSPDWISSSSQTDISDVIVCLRFCTQHSNFIA